MQNKFAAIAMIMVVMIGMTGIGAATEDVTVSIGDGTGDVTIPIVAENVTNLGSCNIRMDFDETVVSVVSVTDGGMGEVFSVIHPGWVRIMAFHGSTNELTGNITIANVTFTPVNDGCSMSTSYLNLTETVLFDATPTGNSIDRNIDNGMYTSEYTGGLNGDANSDGVVDIRDARHIAMYAATISGYDIVCPAIADVDGVDGVDAADAAYLANYLAGNPDYDPLK